MTSTSNLHIAHSVFVKKKVTAEIKLKKQLVCNVPSSSDVGDSVHSIVVANEDCSRDAKSRCFRDVETTITINNTWVITVKCDTLIKRYGKVV